MPESNLQHNTRLRLGVFLLALLSLSACSHTPQSEALPQSDFANVSAELTDVPFYPQTQYQCGPAALATVMQYRDVDIMPEELVDKVYIPEKQGSLQIEMVSATREQGLVPYIVEPELTAIMAQIKAGNPVLVMQNLSYQWMPLWHYAVVVGFDIAENELILRSGETKRWQTSLAAFERTWARSDYWGLVIMPPAQLPAEPAMHRWLSASYDLQQTGQTSAAETAFQTAQDHWQDKTEPGLALANLYFEQEQFTRADTVYQQLIDQHPDNATLWNNRAYTLQATNCHVGARQAAQCALDLTPQDSNVQATFAEMQSADPTNAESCPVVRCPR